MKALIDDNDEESFVKRFVTLFRRFAILLGILSPAASHAQAVAPSELAGTWVRKKEKRGVMSVEGSGMQWAGFAIAYDTLYLGADSTFHWAASGGKDVVLRQPRRWHFLRGDTLSFSPNGACSGQIGRSDNDGIGCE